MSDGTVGDPSNLLRSMTRARVGLGRAGDGLPTAENLRLAAAHAMARDAVHEPLDADALAAELGEGTLVVASAAADRAQYLQRPDLGRRLAGDASLPAVGGDLAIVVADGLSALAVHAHAVAVVDALRIRLAVPRHERHFPSHQLKEGAVRSWELAPIVVARQARVALGDEVATALGTRAVLVLIGERPGMSSPDSLGAYLTWAPHPGRVDSERNCVSNIRPPYGLAHEAAADVLVALLTEAFRRELTGVALKDTGPALPGAAC